MQTKAAIEQMKKDFWQLKKLCNQMRSGIIAENRLYFWHMYLTLYDRMRKLRKEHPYLPKLPKCLLTKEQEQEVKIMWSLENPGPILN